MNGSSVSRPIRILKFGGTSLSDAERIRRAAAIALERQRQDKAVVVVVSAQAKITDSLLQQAAELARVPEPRALDLLLSSGERISAALFAIYLNSCGVEAIGLTGSQAGIITDTNHNQARIIEVRPYRIAEALAAGKVVVVGGFQGVSNEKEITTLGRGGSDITAVVLASALQAERCEIFSDVDGVLTADPRVVDQPLKLDEISYSEMERFSRAGARVLHPEAVARAREGNIQLQARTSFEPHATGTIIRNLDEGQPGEVLGIASLQPVTWVRFAGDGKQLAEELESAGIAYVSLWRTAGVSPACWNILVAAVDNPGLTRFLDRNADSCEFDSKLSLVSLIVRGKGRPHRLLAATIDVLKAHRIRPHHVEWQNHSIRLLLPRRYHDLVVQALHQEFIQVSSQDSTREIEP